jgi:hypothetical protein
VYNSRLTTDDSRLRRICTRRCRSVIGDFVVNAVDTIRRSEEHDRVATVTGVRTPLAAHARRFR